MCAKLQCQLLHSFIRFIHSFEFVRSTSTFARELIHSFICFICFIRFIHCESFTFVSFIRFDSFIHSFIHFYHLFHFEFMFILNLHPSLLILWSLYLSMFSRSCLARFVSIMSEVWSCHIGTVVYMHMTGTKIMTKIFLKQIFKDFLYNCDYLSTSTRNAS